MVEKEQVLRFIDEHRDEMVRLWEDLVNRESFSSDKNDVDQLQDKIKSVLEASGAKVRTIVFEKAGSMIIGEVSGGAKPAVIFSGHSDTVFRRGTIKERPFTIKDGKAYGPGVLDMKGGIVAFLYAIKALAASGYQDRPIKVLLAGDEEFSHPFSNVGEIFVKEAAGCAAAFNCETGFIDDGIVVGRNGVAHYTIEVRGVASHRGNDPENGRSAILEIAHKVIEIEKLNDLKAGISCCVGVIEGGNVANATPDYAKVGIDLRGVDRPRISAVEKKLKDIAAVTYVDGTTTTIAGGILHEPMVTTDGVKRLFNLVKQTSIENNFGTPYEKFSGGGADSAYTVIAGVPTVCAMGVKGGRNHSPEEFAVVESLFERSKLLAACVLNLDRL